MLEQGLNELKQYLNKSNIHKIDPPILAIDYGSKNFGLALSDDRGIVAQPLKILKKAEANYEKILIGVKDAIDEYKIKTIVLGVPQAFKKEHLQNIDSILKFQELLKDFTKKEVFLYDETYSTANSYSILREQGRKQKKSKKKIDKIAATCFLQELLDFKNRQNA